jgi:hypothetical protein
VALSSAQLSKYIIDRLEAALASGKKIVVVDRANLDKIRDEQGFQLSGEVDDESAKSIGRILARELLDLFKNLVGSRTSPAKRFAFCHFLAVVVQKLKFLNNSIVQVRRLI